MGFLFDRKTRIDVVVRRYWVDAKIEKSVTLEGETFHHIFDVCRQTVGSKFEILNEGKAFFVEVESVGKKSATLKVLEVRLLPVPAAPHIHLCVSIPKLPTFETILEKSVELGVFKLHPFVSDYSFVRDVKNERISHKTERWEKIVKSATQQSGRGDLMEISSVGTLSQVLEKMNQMPASMGLFPYEGECQQTVKACIEKMKPTQPQNIWIFVGSEGGFSREEVEFFKERGLEPSTLGEQVLRVETACLALVSIVRHEFTLSQSSQ